MIKIWLIIILCFLGGAIGALSWASDFIPFYDFKYNSKPAMADAAIKSQKPGKAIDWFGESRFEYPLKFKTESGADVLSVAYAPRRAINDIEYGKPAKIIYLKDVPQKVLFDGDVKKMPMGFGSLFFGLVSISLGIVLINYRQSFAGYTKYLGHDDNSDEGVA